MDPRSWLAALCLWFVAGIPARAAAGEDPPVGDADDGWTWVELSELALEGSCWPNAAGPYGRWPQSAAGKLPEALWLAGQAPAGIVGRFATDSTELRLRWTPGEPLPSDPSLSHLCRSGLDLYARDQDGRWRWAAAAAPAGPGLQEVILFRGAQPGRREYQLYLPLFESVRSVRIGVPAGALLEPLTERADRRRSPVVLYGSLGLQGAGASRPGMALSAQLGRRLQRPVANFGLPLVSPLDLRVGALLAEVNATVFVIDVIAVADAPTIAADLGPFVRGLRAARPWCTVLLSDGPTPPASFLLPELQAELERRRAALRRGFETLVADGVAGVYHLAAADLVGADGEGTVDGQYPSDLGLARYADALKLALTPLLQQWDERRE
jgi:hypothetical protein